MVIVGDFVKIGHFKNCELNIYFYRVFLWLSENQKIIEIRQAELEL